MTDEALEPCGNCGAPARWVERAWRVKCTRASCGVVGGKFETRQQARRAWNSRPYETMQRQIDAYRLEAVNQGWNHNMVKAYGCAEYLRQRIAAVDTSAQRTAASGYDAAAYLRDGLAGDAK